jgi:hypothetical protein
MELKAERDLKIQEQEFFTRLGSEEPGMMGVRDNVATEVARLSALITNYETWKKTVNSTKMEILDAKNSAEREAACQRLAQH